MTLGIILSAFLGLNKPDFYEEMFASFDTFRMKNCKKIDYWKASVQIKWEDGLSLSHKWNKVN